MNIDTEKIRKLKKEYGEAFYLLDTKKFRENYLDLMSCFQAVYPHFNIAYSYKTNYIPKLCRLVNESGGYAEVVSEMELELARRVDVADEKIIWNGPVKEPLQLEKLLLGGGCVNVDSIDEMDDIVSFAVKHPKAELHIGLRCNFDIGDGVISRFGFDTNGEDFQKALSMVSAHDNIHCFSFQCHFANRQIDYWKSRAGGMIQVMEETGIIPERIDLGGGLYGHMPDGLKEQFSSDIPAYKDYAAEAATVMADYFRDAAVKPELVIEPGSALAGDCMQFICTVKTIKNVRGKYFAAVLGSQKNISMAGVNPPIHVLPAGNGRRRYENVDIVGYTCIEGDVIYKNYNGELSVGDTLVIDNCGSYSVVMKPPFILPNFPVLDISSGRTEVIKRAEGFDDIFDTYNYETDTF